jgi:CheY-like chemotaxis protein
MPRTRILLADDVPMVREVYQKALESQGWTVEVAGDGQEALEMLHKGHFDVAVLDLVMPHLRMRKFMKIFRAKPWQSMMTHVCILPS